MGLASELCDDPSGINNYAEPSLHLASTFRNRSKQFKSKLTFDHPFVQKFLSDEKPSSKSDEEVEIQSFSEFLKTTTSSPGNKRDCSPDENRSNNVAPKLESSKPTFASAETPRFGGPSSIDAPKQKFPNSNGFGSGEPVRPTFQSSVARTSNVPSSTSGPKFGLPGIGPRPPAAVQRYPPMQRQGSFGKSNDFSSFGKSNDFTSNGKQ
jgi:hypothetical protein